MDLLISYLTWPKKKLPKIINMNYLTTSDQKTTITVYSTILNNEILMFYILKHLILHIRISNVYCYLNCFKIKYPGLSCSLLA